MLAWVRNLLRGEYNSLRYRFVTLPKEWLTYIFLYRLRGKGWVDFYAARLDRAQKLAQSKPIPASYRQEGEMHLDFLKKHGLQPSHTLLDYGCGVCRSGIFLAKYLDAGNYTGADISRERLDYGAKLLQKEGLPAGSFRLVQVKDCRLTELGGMAFDCVFANSVLTHMPEQDVQVMLRSMRPLLKGSGRFFFTYAEAEQKKRRNIKDFWYRRDEIWALCENAGYSFALLGDWPKSGDVMAVAAVRGDRR